MADLGNVPRAYSTNLQFRALAGGVKNETITTLVPRVRNRPRRNQIDTPPNVVAFLLGATSGEVVTLLENGQWVNAARAENNAVAFHELNDGTYVAVSAVRKTAWRIEVVNSVVTVTPLTESGGGAFEPSFAYVS